jgi:hypothetical protein
MTDSAARAQPRPYRLGVIALRHVMPVDSYLVEAVTPGQNAYDLVYDALDDWLAAHPGRGHDPDKPLEVYYSGLTEATLAIADCLHNRRCRNATLMRYDIVLQDYEPLIRRLEWD